MKHIKKNIIACLIFILFSQSIFGNVSPNIYAANKISNSNKISISDKYVPMYIGGTYNLRLLNATKKIKWSSSNRTIVKVSTKGKITALSAGKATITAKYKGKKYKAKVKVMENVISDTNLTLFSGTSWQLAILTSDKMPIWTSSDENVASVNKNGYLIANGKGNAIITAILGKEQFICNVKVVDELSREDFNYETPYSSNFCEDIEKGRGGFIYYILFETNGADYNRGVKIGDTKEEVIDAFGFSTEETITAQANASCNYKLSEINAKTYIGYETSVSTYVTEYIKKYFCFDKYGTLVGILWWSSCTPN